MNEKIGGVGLKNIFVIWLICCLLSLMAKVMAVKYPIKGVTETVMTAA